MRVLACLRDERAASMVEFALLAPFFMAALGLLVDLSLYWARAAALDRAVLEASRTIKLGYVGSNRTARADVQNALCASLLLVPCAEVDLSARAFSHLTAGSLDRSLDSQDRLRARDFNLGGPNDLVVVTVAYLHRFITPLGGLALGDDGLAAGNARAVLSHLVLKNEPFPPS